MTVAAIDRFTDWFGSVACVVETLLACALIAAFEARFPGADPHNFKFLYAMTFYSSVTQPALAYGGARLTKHLIDLIREVRNEQIARREEEKRRHEWEDSVDRTNADMLRAILTILDKHPDTEAR